MLRRQVMLGLGGLAAAAVVLAQEAYPVPVFINGGRLDADALMLPDVSRTVLPMRTLFESLGARVEWDAAQRAVYAWKPDGAGVRLGLGERQAQTLKMSASPAPGNWGRIQSTKRLDAPAMLIGSRVYVPLRFASEALRANVRYVAGHPAVYIQTEAVAGYRQERAPAPPEDVRQAGEESRARLRQALRHGIDVSIAVRGDRFRAGDDVPIVVTVRNRSDRTLAVPFETGQQFDLEVLRENRVLWSWAAHRSFSPAPSRLVLRPGDAGTFSVRWTGENDNGRTLPPGRYLIRAVLLAPFESPNFVAEEWITLGH